MILVVIQVTHILRDFYIVVHLYTISSLKTIYENIFDFMFEQWLFSRKLFEEHLQDSILNNCNFKLLAFKLEKIPSF